MLHSLSLAVAAVLDPRPLPGVLADVVHLGRDTDTNGAIAGGMLGVRDGVAAIPGGEAALPVLVDRRRSERQGGQRFPLGPSLPPVPGSPQEDTIALSGRSRSTIYQKLEPGPVHQRRGEEAVGEMLSYFPARDIEEPAMREFVRAEVAAMRSELHVEIAGLRTTLHQEFRSMLQWLIASFVAINGLLVAAARVLL